MPTPQPSQVILCTGANRGLGFAILHVTALREPSAVYILACRELASGHEALRGLRQLGVKSEVEVIQLDVTDNEHISAAVEFVRAKYGKLDGRSYQQRTLISPCP